ncbi:phytoene desaturase family protein [Nitratidesulfovibrio vulgaris]|uniref:phytoene desaturase family protein n=1 Tax=Nitratidesulfovibrio vulgaris TaxID=881 RepID=UPI002300D039|nr:NAD(P)/FAD-dependent oxidoreductase [Nitratidesulfovibrio vulgaris]WCB47065.1 NAD(P)/FAD-dependent oxidoreductase [Nitratidesulfovibrio vulgaris]
MPNDSVVIGAGVSGMASALILARQGHNVVLVERFRAVGPTLRGFARQGVQFDTGLHYTGSFAPGEILDIYCRFLGLQGLKREPYASDGFDRLRYTSEATEFDLPVGYDALQTYLGDRFPAERVAICTYFDAVRKEFNSSPFLNLALDSPIDAFNAFPSSVTLSDFLRGITDNALLRSVLSVHSLLYGVSPNETPFTNHAKIVGSYYQSVHGVEGGGLAVVRAFERALHDAGVTVLCSRGAARIQLRSDGGVQGVELEDGERIRADMVVCTTHPAVLLDLLPENTLRPVFRQRIRNLVETPSAYMMFGKAEGPVDSIECRNLFVCPETDVAGFFRPARGPAEGPFYVASSRCSGGTGARAVVAMAPGSLMDVSSWLHTRPGKRTMEYKEHKALRLDEMRATLLRHAPELASVQFMDGATPLTLRDYMHTPLGSLYGPRHSVTQFNPMPGTRVPGLLLAGQAVVAPGLLGAMVSAFLTCGFVVGHDNLRKELRACA